MESPKPSRPSLRRASREDGAGPDQKASKPSGSFATICRCCRRCPLLLRYRCCNHPPMLVGLPGKYLLASALSCLALHCLALTPPLSSSIASGRRHAPGPLWLPHLIRPGWRPKRVEKGRGPCSATERRHSAVNTEGRPRMALLWRPGCGLVRGESHATE
jgi:hypothetical protein